MCEWLVNTSVCMCCYLHVAYLYIYKKGRSHYSVLRRIKLVQIWNPWPVTYIYYLLVCPWCAFVCQMSHRDPSISGYFSIRMWPKAWLSQRAIICSSCISDASICQQCPIIKLSAQVSKYIEVISDSYAKHTIPRQRIIHTFNSRQMDKQRLRKILNKGENISPMPKAAITP